MTTPIENSGKGPIRFHFARPHHGYMSLVEQRAVIAPLVGKPGGDVATVIKQATDVLGLYRSSLQARVAANLLHAAKSRKLGNCRPAFAAVRPHALTCHRAYICPSCWARRAYEVWRRVDLALFPQMADGSRADVSPYAVVMTRRRFGPRRLVAYKDAQGVALASVVADRASRAKYGSRRVIPGRSYEISRLAPVGALDIFSLEPRTRPIQGWRATIRQLLVVETGRDVVMPGAYIRRIESPTRRQVAKAVAWAWRYPRGLLLDGPGPASPHAVAVYCRAVRKKRMWAAYGIFNKVPAWDPALHAGAKKSAKVSRPGPGREGAIDAD